MQSNAFLVPYGIYTVTVSVVSLLPAYILNGRWTKENPTKLGFFWGYWFLSNVYVGYALLLGAVIVAGMYTAMTTGVDARDLIFILTVALAVTTVGYHSFKRRRWALVVSTIISLNGLWMIINCRYLRSRWKELELETERFPPRPKIDKVFKMVLFAGLVWSTIVFLHGFLSDTYGVQVSGDEIFSMVYIAIWPSLALFILTIVYRRFVR